jgi:hypothetical protein
MVAAIETAMHSAEGPQVIMAAKELLLDVDWNCVGVDEAKTDSTICSDNDTWEPKTFITEQNNIIGQVADELADHLPDKEHTMKNNNTALFDQ